MPHIGKLIISFLIGVPMLIYAVIELMAGNMVTIGWIVIGAFNLIYFISLIYFIYLLIKGKL